VDFNNDCQSDLVIETVDGNKQRYLEFIVISNNKLGYIDSFKIPSSFSTGSFVFLSSKTLQDLVFFDNSAQELVIYENQNK
jgi:hypothetical protein